MVAPVSGDWYVLARFGSLRLTIGYYIDSLTVAMFCMVTLVASCIHVYSIGYMHDELSEVTDRGPLGRWPAGGRRGRYSRFYQYLSLFCFSMLGLVVAGNMAMVFVFWELVGICSYLLIGFWPSEERVNAANKAFIVNRVGDFGMIVGLMAIWTGMGTFSFGDYQRGRRPVTSRAFSARSPAVNEHRAASARRNGASYGRDGGDRPSVRKQLWTARGPDNRAIAAKLPGWPALGYGYWLW